MKPRRELGNRHTFKKLTPEAWGLFDGIANMPNARPLLIACLARKNRKAAILHPNAPLTFLLQQYGHPNLVIQNPSWPLHCLDAPGRCTQYLTVASARIKWERLTRLLYRVTAAAHREPLWRWQYIKRLLAMTDYVDNFKMGLTRALRAKVCAGTLRHADRLLTVWVHMGQIIDYFWQFALGARRAGIALFYTWAKSNVPGVGTNTGIWGSSSKPITAVDWYHTLTALEQDMQAWRRARRNYSPC